MARVGTTFIISVYRTSTKVPFERTKIIPLVTAPSICSTYLYPFLRIRLEKSSKCSSLDLNFSESLTVRPVYLSRKDLTETEVRNCSPFPKWSEYSWVTQGSTLTRVFPTTSYFCDRDGKDWTTRLISLSSEPIS